MCCPTMSEAEAEAAAFRKFAERGKDLHETSSSCVATRFHRICKTHWEKQFKTPVSQISMRASTSDTTDSQVSSYDKITLPMYGTLWMAFVPYCNHTCAWDRMSRPWSNPLVSLRHVEEFKECMTYRVFAQHLVSYEISQYVQRGAQLRSITPV